MTTTSKAITLAFLGDRDYVQGATLLEALEEHFRGGEGICFKVPRLIPSDNVEVAPFDPDAPPPAGTAATLSWSTAGGRRALAVRSLAPSLEPRREPFDEDRLVNRARFSGESAVLDEQSPFSFARTLVSLNKTLLLRRLSPPRPGQWLFTRLDMANWPERTAGLTLRFVGNLRFQAVSSEVGLGGEKVGTVLFSWLRK